MNDRFPPALGVAETSKAIEAIEAFARHDPGERGFSTAAPGALAAAAAALFAGERILLTTGFCIRAAMIGENDGPPGTYSLAWVLHQLGKQVALVTDEHSAGLLRAIGAVYGVSFPLTVLATQQDEANRQIDRLLADFAPTTVVAIERPGNAIDGHRYSMRGEALDDLVPSADRLLQAGAAMGFTTIAVGDGGNELGLGALRDDLKDRIAHGETIFSITPADHVVPAGISNWGGYALGAALAVLAGQPLLPPPARELEVLETLRAAGAVDGCTKVPALSVDGVPWAQYAVTLNDIYAAASQAIGGPRAPTDA